MSKIDKAKYLKWYKLARDIIQNDELIPDREPWISKEDWLMFAPAWIHSMEEAKSANIPNIFFDLSSRDLQERYGRLGLTFNNLPAVDRLRNILSDYCKDEKELLTKALLSLGTVWSIKVKRKIHYKNYRETPTYIHPPEYTSETNKINERVINDVFEASDRIREEGQQKRKEEKLKQSKSRVAYIEVPSINLMECEFELTEENFKMRIKEIFHIWSVCLKVKSDKEIKEMKLKQQETEIEIQRLKDQLQKQSEHPLVFKATEEQISQRKRRLKELLEEEQKLTDAEKVVGL